LRHGCEFHYILPSFRWFLLDFFCDWICWPMYKAFAVIAKFKLYSVWRWNDFLTEREEKTKEKGVITTWCIRVWSPSQEGTRPNRVFSYHCVVHYFLTVPVGFNFNLTYGLKPIFSGIKIATLQMIHFPSWVAHSHFDHNSPLASKVNGLHYI